MAISTLKELEPNFTYLLFIKIDQHFDLVHS